MLLSCCASFQTARQPHREREPAGREGNPMRGSSSVFAGARGLARVEVLVTGTVLAVLAAISVHAYRPADKGTDLAQVQSDMQAMSVAIEAYAADWDVLPRSYRVAGESRTFLLSVLTTPVAYLDEVPADPFNTTDTDPANRVINYWGPDYLFGNTTVQTSMGPLPIPDVRPRTAAWLQPHFPELSDGTELLRENFYILLSTGPDGVWSVLDPPEGETGGFPNLPVTPYDPTNGTVSYGDIVTIHNDPTKPQDTRVEDFLQLQ